MRLLQVILGVHVIISPATRAFVLSPITKQQQQTRLALDKGFNILEISGLFLPNQGILVQTAQETWKFMWKRLMAELAPQDSSGNYQRPSYTFASSPASPLELKYKHQYHLYVGNPCPWCQRTLLTLYWHDDVLTDYVDKTRLQDNPRKASRGGWIFSDQEPDGLLGGCRDLKELYDTLSPGYKGRCTAPVLVDVKNKRLISNESSDIVRLLNDAARKQQPDKDLYPADLADTIDATNEWVYSTVNNGVYRCGFATTQQAYNHASQDVRQGLERCNEVLSRQPYLCGTRFTQADVRLLPTILRFDGAYAPLFRAGGGHVRIKDYPHLYRWLQTCWKTYPAVRRSIDLADACESYYRQLFPLNPSGIVPYPPVSAHVLGLSNSDNE